MVLIFQHHLIWVSCEGGSAVDSENLGPIFYLPQLLGFEEKYFPYKDVDGYLNPFVAVYFENPMRVYLRIFVNMTLKCSSRWSSDKC